MGFQLWIHDGAGGAIEAKEPMFPKTPSDTYYETIKVRFTITESNAIRIHLHCKAGIGFIKVSEVLVNQL